MKILEWIKSKLAKKEQNSNFDLKSSYQGTQTQDPATVENKPETEADGLKEFGEKARHFLEETGKEVVSQGKEVAEELKEKWKELDENTREFREDVKEKAQEALEKVNEFIDKTIKSGEDKEAEEQKIDQNKDGFADSAPDFGKNLADKHSGFFEKAESFLEGSEKSTEDSPTQAPSDKPSKPTLELPQEENKV